ncbi:MAG: C45 family autoproteolytic acyltransferase/hydrolase [Promethearchaeota archaeon]
MVLSIIISGNPRERGISQGEQLKEKIHAAMKSVFYSDIFKQMKPKFVPVPIAVFGLSVIGKSNIKKDLEKYLPRQHEKLLGIAKGAGISSRLVYGLNFVEVMSGDPKSSYEKPLVQACSMIFAVPPATKNNAILYGRNYDFPPVLQPFQMVRIEKPDDGFKNVNLSQFPLVGTHVGLNEKGLVVGYNYGRSWKTDPLDYRKKGVPMMCLVQEALETCSTMEEVIELVTNFPARTNGAQVGILDSSGKACVIETTATRHALRYPEDGILAHTNLYMTEELKDANVPDDIKWKYKGLEIPYTKSPRERVQRAAQLLSEAKGNITIDTFKSILRDHDNREPDDFTLCTHGVSGATLASIIINPKNLEFNVTDNQPCKTEYELFNLKKF